MTWRKDPRETMRLLRAAARRSPDLLRGEYRAKVEAGAHPLTGHCYVAAEALWHALGGKESGWVPATVRHEGGVHWFLVSRRKTGDGATKVLDPTREQFRELPPYEDARPRGFLTATPSRRARALLDRAKETR